jgi:hypothetical protein
MAILTTQGKQWIIDKLQNAAPITDANCDVIGWGTGSAAEAVGNTFGTANITEAAENRVTGTLSQPAATTDRLVGTMTATGTRSITQVWRTNTTTKGHASEIMFIYALFTAVPVESGDSIAFTIDYLQS